MHRSLAVSILTAAIFAGLAPAAPKINSGAVNAASRIVPGLPDYGVARGALFYLSGDGLGPAEMVRGEFPLGEELGGTKVSVKVGETTVNALIVAASARQVWAILPSATPTGSGIATLTYNGESATGPVEVVAAAFGIFVPPGSGFGNAIAFNGGEEANQLVKSARPGQNVTLIGTGLGATTEDEKNAIAVQDVAVDLKVFVGGKEAAVVSKGKVGLNEMANADSLKLPRGLSAVEQVTFTVPDGVTGCAASVAVQIGDRLSNWATLSVAPEGGVCADLAGLGDLNQYYTGEPLKVGSINMIRTAIGIELGPLGSLNVNSDFGSASFFRNPAIGIPAEALTFSPVSTGQCLALVGQLVDVDTTGGEPGEVDEGTPLDAGEALRIQGPRGTRQLKKVSTGNYSDTLGTGSDTPLPFPVPLPGGGQEPFLAPGEYTVDNGAGGADIGPFQVKATIGAPLNWTNRAQIQAVTRANGVDLTWSGGTAGSIVLIFGFSSVQSGANASFYCIADAAAGRFTVPSQVLMRLPASAASSDPTAATGGLFVANTNGTKVDIPGLDLAVFSTGVMTGKTLSYR